MYHARAYKPYRYIVYICNGVPGSRMEMKEEVEINAKCGSCTGENELGQSSSAASKSLVYEWGHNSTDCMDAFQRGFDFQQVYTSSQTCS